MTIVPKKKSADCGRSGAGKPSAGPGGPVCGASQVSDDGSHQQQGSDGREDHHRGLATAPGSSHSSDGNQQVVVVVGGGGPGAENSVGGVPGGGGVDPSLVAGDYSGYNSGDEHTHDRQPSFMRHWSEQEHLEREAQFEKKIHKKGWLIRKMAEDGACLFRAVADQIYGDQEMHSVLRKLCIDYIAKNSDYFSQYVTEDFGEYLKRKSLDHSHGNHIEIQAMSEMFNRPIEVYHYSSEPINIFQGQKSDNDEPIRLSYHRSVHYNSIVNPYKASVGVGLGLPAYEPGTADRNILEKAIRMSDEDAIEKAMLEDKLLATDWEATNEAIEEQVARESYLEWLRENENRMHKKFKKSSSPQPTTAAASRTPPPPPQQQQQPSTPPPATYHHHHHHHQQQQPHQPHNQSPSYLGSPSQRPASPAAATTNSTTTPTPTNDQQTACCSTSVTHHGTAAASTSASSPSPTTSAAGAPPKPTTPSYTDKLNTRDFDEAGTSSSSPSSSCSYSSSCPPLDNSKRYDSGNYKSASAALADRRSPRASSSRDII